MHPWAASWELCGSWAASWKLSLGQGWHIVPIFRASVDKLQPFYGVDPDDKAELFTELPDGSTELMPHSSGGLPKGASRYDVRIRGGRGVMESRHSKRGCMNFIV